MSNLNVLKPVNRGARPGDGCEEDAKTMDEVLLEILE